MSAETIVARFLLMPGIVLLIFSVRGLLIARAFRDGFHYAIQVKAAGLLPWWEFAEALQPLTDIGTRGREDEHMIHPPLCVTDGLIMGPLERIHAKISEHRRSQCRVGVLPHVIAMSILNQERYFVVVVTQCSDTAIVGPVEELLARPLDCLSLECGQQVVAIKENLVFSAIDPFALQQVLFDGSVTGRGE
jgi:hypothetical protein